MWGENHCFFLSSLSLSILQHSGTLLSAPTQALSEAESVLMWLHLFVWAAGRAGSVRFTCQVQCVSQKQGKMVNNSKWGRLKGMVPIKAASPAAPLLVCWLLLRKKAIKRPGLWTKSYFSVVPVGLDGSALSFLVVWSSLLAEPPSSTFVLLRDTVDISYSATESPDRSVTSLFPTAAGSLAPNGKWGEKEHLGICSTAAPGGARCEQELPSPSTRG